LETDIRFTHRSLVEKCKAGHSSSQYQLYSLYVDAMYNIGMRMLGNKEDAEDIVQDSFVDAFKNLNSFKYDKEDRDQQKHQLFKEKKDCRSTYGCA